MTAHRPVEELRSERPVLHRSRGTSVGKKNSEGRMRRAAEFAVDLVERSKRQFRAVGKAIVAANLRGLRPPEPYKGKGVRYAGEKVRRKPGKAGKGAKASA